MSDWESFGYISIYIIFLQIRGNHAAFKQSSFMIQAWTRGGVNGEEQNRSRALEVPAEL